MKGVCAVKEEKLTQKQKLSALLIVIPAVLILVLAGVQAKRVHSGAAAGAEVIKGASGDGGITVQQKNAGPV